MRVKYVIRDECGGTPILFPEWLNHTQFARKESCLGAGVCSVRAEEKMVEAGTATVRDITVHCWGESVTLEVKSRLEEDEKLIRKMLLRS